MGKQEKRFENCFERHVTLLWIKHKTKTNSLQELLWWLSSAKRRTLAPARKCRCRNHQVSKGILITGVMFSNLWSRYTTANTGLLDQRNISKIIKIAVLLSQLSTKWPPTPRRQSRAPYQKPDNTRSHRRACRYLRSSRL